MADQNSAPLIANSAGVFAPDADFPKGYTRVTAHQFRREAEYPSIQDLVVAIQEKLEGDSDAWDALVTARAAIKSKYPNASS